MLLPCNTARDGDPLCGDLMSRWGSGQVVGLVDRGHRRVSLARRLSTNPQDVAFNYRKGIAEKYIGKGKRFRGGPNRPNSETPPALPADQQPRSA
jgi:hypothetical protein